MKNRRGFTMRELLICIAVVGGLMALLIPKVQKSRRSQNVTSCRTQMRNIAVACLEYESNKKMFPGYDNLLAGKHASWIVMVTPYLERNDIFQHWADPRKGMPLVYLDVLICNYPVNASGEFSYEAAANSYVANCGRVDGGEPRQDNRANGVFLNRYSGQARMTSDFIADGDGLATTALVSENTQAGRWAAKNERESEMTLGFVWHDSPDADRVINGNRSKLGAVAQMFDHARPSSNHSGGVNVAFGQSNVRFISDTIDYKIYQQMLTSDSAKSDLPAEVKAYQLDEKELQ